MIVRENITSTGGPTDVVDADKRMHERDTVVAFKKFAKCTDFISKINYTQVDNGRDIDAVMLKSFKKTSVIVW